MTNGSLSARQRQVLGLVVAHLAAHGYPPTLRELADAIGAKQHASATRHVQALIRKGYLARDYGVPRGLRVLVARLPK